MRGVRLPPISSKPKKCKRKPETAELLPEDQLLPTDPDYIGLVKTGGLEDPANVIINKDPVTVISNHDPATTVIKNKLANPDLADHEPTLILAPSLVVPEKREGSAISSSWFEPAEKSVNRVSGTIDVNPDFKPDTIIGMESEPENLQPDERYIGYGHKTQEKIPDANTNFSIGLPFEDENVRPDEKLNEHVGEISETQDTEPDEKAENQFGNSLEVKPNEKRDKISWIGSETGEKKSAEKIEITPSSPQETKSVEETGSIISAAKPVQKTESIISAPTKPVEKTESIISAPTKHVEKTESIISAPTKPQEKDPARITAWSSAASVYDSDELEEPESAAQKDEKQAGDESREESTNVTRKSSLFGGKKFKFAATKVLLEKM